MADQPIYVAPGQGTTYRVLGGDVITFKLTGQQTDGQFTLAETVTPPDCGPPLHKHLRDEETFHVLEGNFVFHIGDRRIMAGQGSVLHAPPDIPHRFVNVGSTPGRLLIFVRPSGFEHFIHDFAQVPHDQPPDFARIKQIGDKHGIVFL